VIYVHVRITGLGVLTLLLLGAVQFLDIADASIVNVALPSIQRSLHFSQQNLQWVASGYILTYGGFLLLGGRLGDILGRRAPPTSPSRPASPSPEASRRNWSPASAPGWSSWVAR